MTRCRRPLALALALVFAALVHVAPAADASPQRDAARAVWRLGARLASADGHRFWVTADFFRYAEPNNLVLFPAEVSIVDERAQKHTVDRRLERDAYARTANPGTGFRIGDWSLAQTGSSPDAATFDLRASVGEAKIHLHQVAKKKPVTYDFGGGAHQTFTWLDCAGTIATSGMTYRVSGKGWLDRVAGDDAVAPRTGVRSSFVLQLDDRREIVLANAGTTARHAVPQALLVRADGGVEQLGRRQYGFAGHNVWHSTHTTTDYPDQWGFAVAGETPDLLFEPIVLDQESPSHGTGATFYESAFDVFDNTPGSMGARLGSAYGLLAGYGNPGAMR